MDNRHSHLLSLVEEVALVYGCTVILRMKHPFWPYISYYYLHCYWRIYAKCERYALCQTDFDVFDGSRSQKRKITISWYKHFDLCRWARYCHTANAANGSTVTLSTFIEGSSSTTRFTGLHKFCGTDHSLVVATLRNYFKILCPSNHQPRVYHLDRP